MIYEIINIGKGLITEINPENLLLIKSDETSQTYIEEGDNITITGTGILSDPYIINTDLTDLGIVKTINNEVIAPEQTLSIINNESTGKILATKEYVESIIPSVPDGSETKINAGNNITITGFGTISNPYIIDSTTEENPTYINGGDDIEVIGNGSIDNPYVINSVNNQFSTKEEFNERLTDGDFLFVGDITQYTDELTRDAVGQILTNTDTINFDYNDSLNTISAEIKLNSIDSTHLVNNINISEFINDSNYLTTSDLPSNLTLYPTNVISDVSGYIVMVKDIHDSRYNTTAIDVSTPTITTTGQLISQRISDAGILTGNPGVFNVTTFGNIRKLSGSGTAQFYFEVYHRDSAGTETLICTSSISSEVVNGTYAEFSASGIWDNGAFDSTDRIVIKTYANRVAGGSNPVYQFQFGGSEPVRTVLPVPFNVLAGEYEVKANKSDSYTASSSTTYASSKALVEGLGTKVDKSNTESSRLDSAFKWIWCWGDSLTQGAGGTPYPTALAALTNFPIENRGIGGENSSQIKDRFIAEPSHYNKTVIIWAGRNNYTTPATVIADIATMVAALGHTRYFVLSILNADVASEWLGGLDYGTIITLNNDLKAIYGERYIDVRAHLVSLHNNSAQDLIDFSHDIPPASLRFDHIHLNTDGYARVAEYLNSKLGVLLNQTSFLQAKDIDYYTITPYAPVSTNYIPYISNNGKSITNSNIYYTGVDVGIGTTTPGAKLDVNGDIRVADNGLLAFGWGFAGVTGNSSTQSVGLFSWNGSGTTERLRATNSGAILINTFSDNLTDKLQVNGSISATNYTGGATLTGTPAAPTATVGTNTTQIATTAFVLANNTPVQNLQSVLSQGANSTIPISITESSSYSYGVGALVGTSSTNSGLVASSASGYGALIESTSSTGALISSYSGNGASISSTTSTGLNVGVGSTSSSNIVDFRKGGALISNIANDGYFEGGLRATGPIRLKNYTVATLPTGVQGDTAFVTDATAPTYLGTLIGGGSVVTPVFYNGTAWVSH